MFGRRRKAARQESSREQLREQAEQDTVDADRGRRLAARRLWNPHGLTKRWRRPLDRAEHALATVTESLESVRLVHEPGRAFAQAQRHLHDTRDSTERAVHRCQDIALAAQDLQRTLAEIPKDNAEDRGRISARLEDAEQRIAQHVRAMESAAIAARELVLQSTLTSRDEQAVMEIDARLRSVSQVLDTEAED